MSVTTDLLTKENPEMLSHLKMKVPENAQNGFLCTMYVYIGIFHIRVWSIYLNKAKIWI